MREEWKKIDLEPAHQSVDAYVLMHAREKLTYIQEIIENTNAKNYAPVIKFCAIIIGHQTSIGISS